MLKVDLLSQRVVLPVHMALEGASRWHDQLIPCLEVQLMTLDGGEVQDIDVPAFEALVAFCLTRAHRGLVTRWSTVSPALRQRIEHLGLRSMLLLPAAS